MDGTRWGVCAFGSLRCEWIFGPHSWAACAPRAPSSDLRALAWLTVSVPPTSCICAACFEPAEGPLCAACGQPTALREHLRLVEVLGSGPQRRMLLAIDTRTGERVAVKEHMLDKARGAKEDELFRRGAEVLRQLQHERIPAYRESFVVPQGRFVAHYLVQEWVDGTSLDEELRTRRYTEEEVLEIVGELAEILAFLHGLQPPIIHRDLKPGNVMRRTDGSLVLVDFDAVRDAPQDADYGGSTVVGTFGYMAPEQFRGDATTATDIYGLGALAVALLSRKDPSSLLGYDQRLAWRDAVSARPATTALLASMLEPDPAARLGSASELVSRVRSLLAPKPSPKPAKTKKRVTASRTKRGIPLWFVGLLVVGVGLAALLLSRDPASVRVARAQCASGVLDACERLAEALLEEDPASALQLFRTVCDGRSGDACFQVGNLTLASDPVGAEAAYGRACDGGVGRACSRLGYELESRDMNEAYGWYERACSLGDGHGCANQATHLWGTHDVPADFPLAAELSRRGCELGAASGCMRAGVAYAKGYGVGIDAGKAEAYFDRGCDGGSAQACLLLASSLDKGVGTIQDRPRALELYSRACEGGELLGCDWAGSYWRDGLGGSADWDKARGFFDKACSMAVSGTLVEARGDACARLGAHYDARNDGRAEAAYRAACEVGHQGACGILARR
jgi:TPR repeat protein